MLKFAKLWKCDWVILGPPSYRKGDNSWFDLSCTRDDITDHFRLNARVFVNSHMVDPTNIDIADAAFENHGSCGNCGQKEFCN